MRNFIRKLLQQHKGQIIASNILDGYERKLYDAEFVKQLVELWKEMYIKHGKSDEELLLLQLDNVLFKSTRHQKITHPAAGRDFKITFNKATRLIKEESVLITIVTSHIFGKIIDIPDFNNILGSTCTLDLSKREFRDDELDDIEEALEKLIEKTEAEREVRLKNKASIGLRNDLVWYTTKERIDETLLTASDRVERIRDALGLVQRKKNDVLFALHIPGRMIKSVRNGRPTFADAGSKNTRFRARADKASNEKRAHWGDTIDLECINSGHSCLDGLPWRVAQPLLVDDWIGVPKITFTPIGIVKTERGKTASDDDERFAGHMCNGRTIPTLENELMDILK